MTEAPHQIPAEESAIVNPNDQSASGADLEPVAWTNWGWAGNVRWRGDVTRATIGEGQGLILESEHKESRASDAARITELEAELSAIYDAFGIGEAARTLSTLKINLRNLKHFAGLLHAVEREFFMVPGEPSGEPEDEGAVGDDQCLVNSWGSSSETYVEQVRAALPHAACQAHATGDADFLVVDPDDSHHICYATRDFSQAQSWAVDGLRVYGPAGSPLIGSV